MLKNKYKPIRLIMLLTLLIVLFNFSGCSSVGTDVEGFLKPPQSTKEMQKLGGDIKKIIGNDTVPIFPGSGSFRNSVNFTDIDNDGTDEAAVSYLANTEDKLAHILILKKIKDNWVTFCNIKGSGMNIDVVDFIDFDGDGKKEIVAGWQLLETGGKGLSVYSITETGPGEILTTSYTTLFITALDKSNIMGIFTVASDIKSAKATGKLIKNENGLPRIVSECVMDGSALSYGSIYYEQAGTGGNFYINESKDDTILQTEIIKWDGASLANLSYANDNLLFADYLRRTGNIYSQDIDSDGLIEIPKNYDISIKQNTLTENISLTEWFNFSGSGFTHKLYSLINSKEIYYINFPANWLNKVLVKNLGTALTFYIKNVGGNDESLFSINALSPDEWKSKEGLTGWAQIKTYSDRVYALYTFQSLSSAAKNYLPAIEEVRQMFIQTAINQR